jgi:hypothetical protein
MDRKLLEKTKHVLVCRFPRKLAVCDAMYDGGGYLELVACPWNDGKIALAPVVSGRPYLSRSKFLPDQTGQRLRHKTTDAITWPVFYRKSRPPKGQDAFYRW